MRMDKTEHCLFIIEVSFCCCCQALQVPAVQLVVHAEGEHAEAPQGEARGAGR